jgi:hypothetical protein
MLSMFEEAVSGGNFRLLGVRQQYPEVCGTLYVYAQIQEACHQGQ